MVSGSIRGAGYSGLHWSGAAYASVYNAYNLFFYIPDLQASANFARFYGFMVRKTWGLDRQASPARAVAARWVDMGRVDRKIICMKFRLVCCVGPVATTIICVPEDAPFYVKDYYDYYKTPRGYYERSLNLNGGWNKTSALSFINTPQLAFADEIRSAVLIIHGDKAHSCYFSKDTYAKLQGDNKELMLIPGAVHTDLYDRKDIIPFEKIVEFYRGNLQ